MDDFESIFDAVQADAQIIGHIAKVSMEIASIVEQTRKVPGHKGFARIRCEAANLHIEMLGQRKVGGATCLYTGKVVATRATANACRAPITERGAVSGVPIPVERGFVDVERSFDFALGLRHQLVGCELLAGNIVRFAGWSRILARHRTCFSLDRSIRTWSRVPLNDAP